MAIPVKYNIRSVLVRRVSTLMTVLSIALVVAVTIGVMALATGLETALVSTGDPLNILVRRRGADSELSSFVTRDAWQVLRYLPGVVTHSSGEPLASADVVVVINLPKRGSDQGANVTIRGVSPMGMALRPQVRLVEGRMFQAGLREVIVSRRISERFQHTSLGDRLRFGKGEWTVVGLFDAGQTAFDSEIWTDVNQLASDYNRQFYSSVLLRAVNEAAARDIISRVENERRYNLTAEPETEYFREQTQAAAPIKAMGMFIAFILGIGACFAAMNTMYAAVTYRTREIATLRVLGFRKGSILLSFIVESVLLALVGGVVGCLLVLPINGVTTGTANWQTFSEIAFAFRVTPRLLLAGMIFAILIGLFGGFFPARQAARQVPALALRQE
ncbi:MAG TPA: FtsX-like permease family protein [Blastocatellia bacterium]|nr:FtsX-like permease family protein [Blastocatellia bacterium]